MITSIFSKSRPFNYIIVTTLTVLLFLLSGNGWKGSLREILESLGLLTLLVASLYITNFVTKRNGMSRDSTYPFLFFFVFLIFFPTLYDKPNIIIPNFFVLLALRRLISLQSMLSPKQKIFDASLWICIAALFQFWCILYLLLVFISIILHVSRDYRNWVLPYIAFFGVGSSFLLTSFVFDKGLLQGFLQRAQADLSFNYFTSNLQNVALSVFTAIAFLVFFALLLSLGKKPLILHASYKKAIFAFLIAAIIFLVSPGKDNSLLAFTYMPLAIMATSYIESIDNSWVREVFAFLICGIGLAFYILQV